MGNQMEKNMWSEMETEIVRGLWGMCTVDFCRYLKLRFKEVACSYSGFYIAKHNVPFSLHLLLPYKGQ